MVDATGGAGVTDEPKGLEPTDDEGVAWGVFVPGRFVTPQAARALERAHEMMRAYQAGETMTSIAKRMGTDHGNVSKAIRGLLKRYAAEIDEDAALVRATINDRTVRQMRKAHEKAMEGNLAAMQTHARLAESFAKLNGLDVVRDTTPTFTINWSGIPIAPPPAAVDVIDVEVVELEDGE